MAKATIAFHPPGHKWFLAPDFSAIALSDDTPINVAIDYVLRAKKRSVMPAEREALENAVKRAVSGDTVGALKQLDEDAWKDLQVPLVCRVYLQHLIQQSVSLTKQQLLECDFNSGLAIDWNSMQAKLPQLLALGFSRDEALEALVVSGRQQVDLAAQYLLTDPETRRMERQRARKRLGKHVPPNRHHTIIERAKEDKRKMKEWAAKTVGQLELQLVQFKRQLAQERLRTEDLTRQRDEVAQKNRLTLYQEFLRGVIAEPVINPMEIQRMDQYRLQRNLTNEDHANTLKTLNLSEKVLDEMKTFEELGDNEDECLVCYEPPKDHMILPCHHVCLCATCAEAYQETIGDDAKCPLCDKDITAIKQIFYF